jgi:hnRNP-L/PTB/hephaestus splicing factor
MGAMGGMGGGSPVVLVNKLNPELTTAETLFSLFGVYGNVMRVKVLYNKRDTAMVQFNTPGQAAAAVMYLNGAPLHGSQILVNPSKHQEIKMPRDTESESGLTQDYTTSDRHRYKQGYNTPKNLNAPSQVLHVANIHESSSVADIAALFQSAQPDSQALPVIEFFKTSRKMAYVGMSSVEAAVGALISLHNTTLGNWPIRVSFSPKDPATLVPSSD